MKKFSKTFLTILLILNMMLYCYMGATLVEIKGETQILNNQVKLIENKLDLYNYHYRRLINEVLESYQTWDLRERDKIKEANLELICITTNRAGSGTHIKINDLSYILTCAHLCTSKEDVLYAIDDRGKKHPTKLILIDFYNDLALLRCKGIKNSSFLNISNKNPKEGSKVIVIGNPSNLTDVFTYGIIAKVNFKTYLSTNLIYPGNSGGALVYKNEIIGVLSKIRIYTSGVIKTSYSESINLKTIKKFLRRANEKISRCEK